MEKGLLIVITGKGKGITAPALGTMFRALGRGFRVCLIQYVKETRETADAIATAWAHPLLEIHMLGEGLEAKSDAPGEETQASCEAWQFAQQIISSGKFQVVVLDKFSNLMKNGFVSPEEVASFLENRPANVHVIVTGNDVPEPLIAAADLVTEAVEAR